MEERPIIEHALTTIDNPYDPFDQFDSWWLFDIDNDYCSCELLNKFAHTSDSLTERENNEEIERAIDEIVSSDILNIYKKVSRQKSKEDTETQLKSIEEEEKEELEFDKETLTTSEASKAALQP